MYPRTCDDVLTIAQFTLESGDVIKKFLERYFKTQNWMISQELSDSMKERIANIPIIGLQLSENLNIKLNENADLIECCICFGQIKSDKINMLVLSCGHPICDRDIKVVNKCPLCRCKISSWYIHR